MSGKRKCPVDTRQEKSPGEKRSVGESGSTVIEGNKSDQCTRLKLVIINYVGNNNNNNDQTILSLLAHDHGSVFHSMQHGCCIPAPWPTVSPCLIWGGWEESLQLNLPPQRKILVKNN